MGTYVCFDRHIHIGYETRTNCILSQLGYVDINEQMLNEIVWSEGCGRNLQTFPYLFHEAGNRGAFHFGCPAKLYDL